MSLAQIPKYSPKWRQELTCKLATIGDALASIEAIPPDGPLPVELIALLIRLNSDLSDLL